MIMKVMLEEGLETFEMLLIFLLDLGRHHQPVDRVLSPRDRAGCRD